ncbi:single-stranded DNA-binding protein [Pseudooceanicola sp. CBS1P-1]|uniref:Single-stranded DNA-binding protein n=1 Tax=Pseudooceanicola albus TaxID=2692189 RepID=A0A6L7G9T5_9RHOB|nr:MULTISPECIES: single-stranded DNA-binding protein [Pseudooceanicola]MBT9386603.1 single-stranded DNA-binding protein [Pseudooceanicola endophyticus]MXN20719.1 single-stranded DNA-binding protein [Pseudooceanicola albus]
MAGSLNRVILIGNLGHDPEVRTFQNGSKVVNLRIATSENWTDRTTQERRERTEWHNVSLYADRDIDAAQRFLRKGSKVAIEGALETRKWQDQNGQDRYATEITVRTYRGALTLLDAAPGQHQGQPASRGQERQGSSSSGPRQERDRRDDGYSSQGERGQEQPRRDTGASQGRYGSYQRDNSSSHHRTPY